MTRQIMRRANIAAKAAPTIESQRQIAFQRLRDKRKQLLFLKRCQNLKKQALNILREEHGIVLLEQVAVNAYARGHAYANMKVRTFFLHGQPQ